MPTYEYECKTCGSTFDMFQSITASPKRKTRCETCDKVSPVRRLIGTGGAVIFKGSGFYQTDYRSEGYKKAAKAETDGAPKSGETGGKEKSTDAANKDTSSGDSKKTESKKTASKAKPSTPKSDE